MHELEDLRLLRERVCVWLSMDCELSQTFERMCKCLLVLLIRGPACEWYVLHVSWFYYSGARRASGTSSMSPVVLFRGPACEWYVLHVSWLYYSGARRASGTSSMSHSYIIQGPGVRVVCPPCLPVVLFRGPACEWYDALSVHLQHSKNVRNWFAQNILFAHPHRFSEYLLECPSSEVGRCEQSVT